MARGVLRKQVLCFGVAVLFAWAGMNGCEAGAGGPHQADVVVYGATPGGFCAAIAAAREGAEVVLLEPTEHIGGLSTGGLSHCDSNQMVRSTLMGLFHEWHTRIDR